MAFDAGGEDGGGGGDGKGHIALLCAQPVGTSAWVWLASAEAPEIVDEMLHSMIRHELSWRANGEPPKFAKFGMGCMACGSFGEFQVPNVPVIRINEQGGKLVISIGEPPPAPTPEPTNESPSIGERLAGIFRRDKPK